MGTQQQQHIIDPSVQARYFKQFWKKPIENLSINAIKFGVFSERDIDQLSLTQITNQLIYDPDTTQPNESGPLDPRLGVSGTGKDGKNALCATCNLNTRDCVGHFGHIDLVLPCFHIGYIKDVIQILRIICKSCSRCLLSPSHFNLNDEHDPNYWRQRMSARSLSRGEYIKYLKRLIDV